MHFSEIADATLSHRASPLVEKPGTGPGSIVSGGKGYAAHRARVAAG
jgi:hypothetical protein